MAVTRTLWSLFFVYQGIAIDLNLLYVILLAKYSESRRTYLIRVFEKSYNLKAYILVTEAIVAPFFLPMAWNMYENAST